MSGNSSKNQCRRQEAVMQLKNSSPFILCFKMLPALRAAKGEICHGSLLLLFVSQFLERWNQRSQKKRCISDLYTPTCLPQHQSEYRLRNAPCKKHGTISPYLIDQAIYKVVVCRDSLKNCTFKTLFLSYRTVNLHVCLAFFLVRIMCDSRNIKWIS